MRIALLGLLALGAGVGWDSTAYAQLAPVEITDIRVGLPPGRFVAERGDSGEAAHVSKNHVWAPVYVDFAVIRQVTRKAAIVLETKDAEDLKYTTWVPLPDLTSLPPGTELKSIELPQIPYVKPSGQDELIVSIRVPGEGNPANWRSLSAPKRIATVPVRNIGKYVVLSLGTKLPGFDLPKENQGDTPPQGDAMRALRGGRLETAAITQVAQMPDRWFGYDTADIVILTTGASDRDFLQALFTDPAYRNRLDALVEWVRRGGRLVVSVGSNAGLVSQFESLREILPADLNRADAVGTVDELSLDWLAGGTRRARLGFLQARGGSGIPVANLTAKPGPAYRTLVPPPDPSNPMAQIQRPVVVQSTLGLGRVTLVAFDLDRSPFLDMDPARKAEFWDLLLREAGAAKASASAGSQKNVGWGGGYGNASDDSEEAIANALRNHIDNFAGVPVISFGWVALFIILYTLLIGPVEYFILKKVFHRLELTWITFPIIVLSVSAIAYFTAYSLKGNDLRLNKADLVDVDPASGRVYGTTWFTIFSPRIDNYTIGIQPKEEWLAQDQPQLSPLVDSFGAAKSGRSGLFSRSFEYHVDPATGAFADGIVDVPIQVWSTKAFKAEWSTRMNTTNPIVVSNLVHPPARREDIAGTFTLNLPFAELRDVRLIYGGLAYKLDNSILPGAPVNVFLDKSKADPDWLSAWNGAITIKRNLNPEQMNGNLESFAPFSIMGLLFHEATQKTDDASAQLSNASMRRLDQSWRIAPDNREELIVLGRVAPEEGSSEEILTAADSASPTQLWLKNLPAQGQARTPVPGTLRQETYVRIFVPIRPPAPPRP